MISETQKRILLTGLVTHGNTTKAAQAAGMWRSSAKLYRNRADFQAKMAEARAAAAADYAVKIARLAQDAAAALAQAAEARTVPDDITVARLNMVTGHLEALATTARGGK